MATLVFRLLRNGLNINVLHALLSSISILIALWSIYIITLRLQDINQSKWWAILVLVLLPFGLLLLLLVPGSRGNNTYGPRPQQEFDSRIFKDFLPKDPYHS